MNAQGPNGEVLEEEHTSSPITLTGLAPGYWNLTLSVVDDEGAQSNQVNLSANVEALVLAYTLEAASDPYSYTLDASQTKASGELYLLVEVSLDGNILYSEESASLVRTIPVFNKDGYYDVVIRAYVGQYSQEAYEYVNVDLPDINGDVIPSDPGSDGTATLAGVDADQDGVRDDIELWVNAKTELNITQQEQLKKMSKRLQKGLELAENKEASVEATYDELSYQYCLEYHLGEEAANALMKEMKYNYYNTKARVMAWARSQVNFAGQAVVLDTNEQGYGDYCE